MHSTDLIIAAPTPATAGDAPGADAPVWHLVVAYDGADFHGWQVQSDLRTVQGELLKRLRGLLRMPDLRIAGTSRTDAGVHALDQHVSFQAKLPGDMDGPRLQIILNRQLPPDMRVLRAEQAPPGFHARYSAWGKAYSYMLYTGKVCNPFAARYVWHRPGDLDVEAMRRAAACLTGKHDFASFSSNPRREIETTVREILALDIVEGPEWICFSVAGRSFLYRMVRTIVGFLVAVGAGRRRPEDAADALEARERTRLNADTAPAPGLFLARVFFSEYEWKTYRPVIPPLGPDLYRPDPGGAGGE